jgi:hypothetical protein
MVDYSHVAKQQPKTRKYSKRKKIKEDPDYTVSFYDTKNLYDDDNDNENDKSSEVLSQQDSDNQNMKKYFTYKRTSQPRKAKVLSQQSRFEGSVCVLEMTPAKLV